MIKGLLIFAGGLIVGAFAYHALTKNTYHQQIVTIITEVKLNRVKGFLETKNVSDAARYCVLYRTAKFNANELSQQIEAALDGSFRNDLILSNLDMVQRILENFASEEKEGLEYDCENT